MLNNLFPSKGQGGTLTKFSDPFILPSNEAFPTEIRSTFDFSLYLYHMNPLYGAAMNRVFAYFLTDIAFKSPDQADNDETKKFKKILKEDLSLFTVLQSLGQNWACYGNAFLRMHRPFDRSYRVLKKDGTPMLIAASAIPQNLVEYKSSTLKYMIPDPFGTGPLPQRSKIEVDFVDHKSSDTSRLSLMFLDPRNVELDKCHFTGEKFITYRFPPHVKARINAGDLREVNNTPRSMLEVIAQDGEYLFNPGEIFHFSQPTVEGISEAGWGIPTTVMHYRNLHQLQVYRKIDEAIGLDYLTPFRVFSPEHTTNTTDSTQQLIFAGWRNELQKMIDTRRKDPTAMHAFPFPLRLEEFGAEGKQYAPKDLIDHSTQNLLDSIGMPQELFRGTLAITEVPTAMRMFESAFQWLMHDLNACVDWVGDKVQKFRGQDAIDVCLDRPSYADNIESRQALQQLVAGGEVRRDRLLNKYGIPDAVAEGRARAQEDVAIQKAQSEVQADFEREQTQGSMAEVVAAQAQDATASQQGGAPAPGGAPIQPSAPSAGQNPLDIQGEAEQLAAQLLQIQEDGARSRELNNIKATNPTLHAAVKQKMEEFRSGAASQGRAQVGEMLAGG